MQDLDKIIDDAVTNPVLSEAADEIGKNLLDAMIGELTLIPHPTMDKQNVWSTRKQADQDATIQRFKSRVRSEVLRFFQHVMANGNPATAATLDKVIFTDKGIQGMLAIDRNSRERHALADFAGERVVVIMPDDLEQYFESMGEVVSSDDQAELDLGANETIDVPPDDGDKPPAPELIETDDSDGELAHALSLHAISVQPEIVARWNSEWLETAWKWVEEMESETERSPALPSFLEDYVEQGGPSPVDQATSDASDGGNGHDTSPETESVAAATESEPKVATDKRMIKALVEECLKLAAEIGEGAITKTQFKKKGRDGLFDYIAYANGRKKNPQAETSNDATQAGTAELVATLAGLTIHVEASAVESWASEDRTLVQDYADRMSSGKLPKQIPEILAPYLLGNDESPTD